MLCAINNLDAIKFKILSMANFDLERWTKTLLKCEHMANHELRQDVIKQLRGEIFHKIPYRSEAADHVRNIVLTCRDFDGGLTELLNILGQCEGESMAFRVVKALLDASPTAERPPSRLLTYMINRIKQKDVFDKEFAILQQNYLRRPFICVVHGDEKECLEMFIERLLVDILPKHLKFAHVSDSLKYYYMQWPDRRGRKQNPNRVLQENLSRALFGNTVAETREMAEELFLQAKPVLIHTQVMTEEWDQNTTELARAFMKMWSLWPDNIPGNYLIVCLALKYLKPIGGLRKKLKYRNLNRSMRHFLDELNFLAFDHLHGVVLPELCAISRNEVETWGFEYAREYCQIDILFENIRDMYTKYSIRSVEGRISMEDLARELRKLLGNYQY